MAGFAAALIAALITLLPVPGAAPVETPAPTATPAALVSATCTRVVDGDTIVCDAGGGAFKVRLIGVDTPETVHPEKAVEALGPEASAYTKAALTGQTVFLEYDVERADRYGRDLCYVWLPDGTLFNDQLVREGFASVATFPPNVKYVERFTESARLARERGAGLYAQGNS